MLGGSPKHYPRINAALHTREDNAGVLTFYHADELGTVVRTTDALGQITLVRQYEPWGALQTSATEPGYAFTGREWDPEIGLYYYRARYYDASLGRFISPDPILREAALAGYVLGAASTAIYQYARNSPGRYVDPTGWSAACPNPPPNRPCPDPAEIAACAAARSNRVKIALAVYAGALAIASTLFVACISLPNPNKPACINAYIAQVAAADVALAGALAMADLQYGECLANALRKCRK